MLTKNRSTISYYFVNGVRYELPNWNYETIITSSRPSPVYHKSMDPATGHWGTFRQSGVDRRWDLVNYQICSFETWISHCYPAFNEQQLSLNRDKLYTTNKFGLLQFFAELDDSIALFTKKFWKSLSYGSFTWGVLPFVSEVKNLLSFLSTAHKGFGPGQRYEDQQSKTFVTPEFSVGGGGLAVGNFTVVTRYSGWVTFPGLSEAQKWLDRLGFHPDINVAWDLLPLSFMVDWFLPVGRYLESIHSSGWIRQASFSGWVSYKVTGTIVVVRNSDPGTVVQPKLSTQVKYYQRNRLSASLSLKNPPAPVLSDVATSWSTKGDGTSKSTDDILKNVFNTAYLVASGRSKK